MEITISCRSLCISVKLPPWLLLFFLLNLMSFRTSVVGQQDLAYCGRGINYTGSAYGEDLNSAISLISRNIGDEGFYNASIGEAPDRITAAALCTINLQLEECRKCILDTATIVSDKCPSSKEGIVWRESCTLRYSNESFLGSLTAYPYTRRNFFWQVKDIDFTEFNTKLRVLIDDVQEKAADSPLLYATGNITAPGFVTLYAMEQCWQDINAVDCRTCLDIAKGKVPECCNGTMGADILLHSCSIRYKSFIFYNMSRVSEVEELLIPPSPRSPPTASSSASQAPPPAGRGGGSTGKIIAGVAVPVAICILVAVIVVIICSKNSKKKKGHDETTPSKNLRYAAQLLQSKLSLVSVVYNAEPGDIRIEEAIQYDFARIVAATNDFSDQIGHGGFGAVYKGSLEDGSNIAVKRLYRLSSQGDSEFRNEVSLLAKLQHRNLVRLFGYAIQRTERLLIFEYVVNGSLDSLLFDPVKNAGFDWDKRYRIIVGIARGLVYLHEDAHLRITHRDLKASNILLDGEMNPKIADFGAARLMKFDETNTSRIVGTYGYMPPEYIQGGQVSSKTDVYGFGVLVLEIVSGQKNSSFPGGGSSIDLLTFIWRRWQEGAAERAVDPVLMGDSRSPRDILKCIHIGLLCVQRDPAKRPSMSAIVTMLNSSSVTMPVPSQPGFFRTDTVQAENEPSQTNYVSMNGLSTSDVVPTPR